MTWFIAALIGYALYWVLPQLVVRFLSNDQKNPKPRKEKNYWATKIDPGHGKVSMMGGVPNRLFPGPGYKFAGDDLSNRASWIASERKAGEGTGGGRLSIPMKFLDAWLYTVTKYRFIGRTVLDTISPTTELYLREIKRESHEWQSRPDRPKDITDHFILTQQRRPFRFSEAETSRAGVVKIGGQDVPADEGVPLEGTGTFLLRLVDIWKVLFEIGGDELSLSKEKAEEGAREIIQGGIAEQFLGATGKSFLSDKLATIDDSTDKDGNTVLEPWKDENRGSIVKPGTLFLYGFEYITFILTDLDLGGKFKDLFRKKAEERVTGLASKEAAEREFDVAEIKLKTANVNAKASVALEKEELVIIQESVEKLRTGRGQLESADATSVLISREKRKGIQGYRGSTLVLTEGGQQTPVVLPVQGAGSKTSSDKEVA